MPSQTNPPLAVDQSLALPARFIQGERARERFGASVERLGSWLLRVDPLADAVVEDFAAMPAGEGQRIFERALAEGLARPHDAPASLCALLAEVVDVPLWVDDETLEIGGSLLLRAGALGGLVLAAKSLVHGYASPGGNKPLVFSGQLVERAPRRLTETSRFVQAVCLPGGMLPFGEGFCITLKVRLMHAHVRRMIRRSGRFDEAAWGAPINQHDMLATILLFSAIVMSGLDTFGIQATVEERERYMKLWRWVGTVIGVDAKLLPSSEQEARRLMELIALTEGAPDDDSRALVRALMESPLQGVDEGSRPRALRQVQVTYGLCRGLVGDEMADRLGLPRDRYRHVVPMVRQAIRTAERVRRVVPGATDMAIRAGIRYWERVVEQGLGGVPAEFRPPTRLAG